MPRIARKDLLSNYLHLMTQGIQKEYIFRKEEYKEKYLHFVCETLEEYDDVKLLVYCIMGNHAHFIMHTTNVNSISKAMNRINTKYAIYYNKKRKG